MAALVNQRRGPGLESQGEAWSGMAGFHLFVFSSFSGNSNKQQGLPV